MLEKSERTTLHQLTLLPEDSLANLTVLPGTEEAQEMTATSGRSLAALLRKRDRNTSLLRTFLVSSPPTSTRCLLTWNTRDTPAGRLVYRLWPSMRHTNGHASSLWPTPRAQMSSVTLKPSTDQGHATGGPPKRLEDEVAREMFPTPQANDWKSGTGYDHGDKKQTPQLRHISGGLLNPMWVEWLMGFPIGWTDLEHSETQSSHK